VAGVEERGVGDVRDATGFDEETDPGVAVEVEPP
jgi:hypothetical protein